MDLSNLKAAKGSLHKSKRLGRGEGSKKGGTSGKGHKGAQSRSGYKKVRGFEGGQMPLNRRIPKFGFKNVNRKEYTPINLDLIQDLIKNKKIKNKIELANLVDLGLIRKGDLVKVLGRGKLDAKIEISAHKFSVSAKKAIEEKEGKAILI